MRDVSTIPVCSICLELPQPLATEFTCRKCSTPFIQGAPLNDEGLCFVCSQGDANFDAIYCFGDYEGALQQLIHLYKYSKVESLAKPLSQWLARALPRDQAFDAVVAMPMHWRKRLERGFNQAELLAKPIAARYGLKLCGDLRRSRRTASQAGLTGEERRKNLTGSFCVRRSHRFGGAKILLIDDVFTTGATLQAATGALKAAGAVSVTALTLARVDRSPTGQSFAVHPDVRDTARRVLRTGTEAL